MVIIDFLHITPGLPSVETMDRYNRHIMYYDLEEVMASKNVYFAPYKFIFSLGKN